MRRRTVYACDATEAWRTVAVCYGSSCSRETGPDVTPVRANGEQHSDTVLSSRGERWQLVKCLTKRNRRRVRRRLFCRESFDIFSRLPTPQMNSVRASNVSRRPRRVSRPRPVQPDRNHQERGNIPSTSVSFAGRLSSCLVDYIRTIRSSFVYFVLAKMLNIKKRRVSKCEPNTAFSVGEL